MANKLAVFTQREKQRYSQHQPQVCSAEIAGLPYCTLAASKRASEQQQEPRVFVSCVKFSFWIKSVLTRDSGSFHYPPLVFWFSHPSSVIVCGCRGWEARVKVNPQVYTLSPWLCVYSPRSVGQCPNTSVSPRSDSTGNCRASYTFPIFAENILKKVATLRAQPWGPVQGLSKVMSNRELPLKAAPPLILHNIWALISF